MINEKAGVIAGKIWNALNEQGTLTGKDLKKAAGKLNDKDLFLGLGWLAREGKITTAEIEKGLRKLILHEEKLQEDLNNTWAVVAEAIQTILRREAYPHPYEALKALTRTNKHMTEETIHEFIQGLNVSDSVKAELMAITPSNYTGI